MELLRALAALCEPPGPETDRLASLLELGETPRPEEHADLFTFQLYPYASVWLGPEGMLGGEARARIADFWRALGTDPPEEPDHLATLLSSLATLQELGSAAGPGPARDRLRHTRRALLFEHLLSWLPPWLARVEELGTPAYRRWARLLREALAAQAQELGPPPETEPLHLRAAPPLPDPRTEGGEALLAGLLAPARSGLFLLRHDLTRAARELELGRRVGERRFELEALLGQHPAATLSWLAEEAETWARRHLEVGPATGASARAWSERATTSATLLAELVAEADGD